MIHLLIGNKIERQKFIHDFCHKNSISLDTIHHIYENDFKDNSFDELVSPYMSLFGGSEYYVVHNSVRILDIKDILKDHRETQHVIFFSEETLLKKDFTIFKKYEIPLYEFIPEKKVEAKRYNTFSLADLLGKRDKKNLWLDFRKAIETVSAEEIHGILFWQIKNLALVKNSIENPGLSPYVYSKNTDFVKKYSDSEIKELAQKMIHMYHKRDTYSTLEIDLEKFILAL